MAGLPSYTDGHRSTVREEGALPLLPAAVMFDSTSRPQLSNDRPTIFSVRSTSTHMVLAVAVNPGITYDSIEAAPGGALGIPITDVNINCSTGSTALVRAGDAHCALALGFERMAPGALGTKPAFPDRPSPMGPLLGVAERASPDSKRGPPMPCMFGACSGGVFQEVRRRAAKNHKHSVNNPYAQFRAGYDEAAVLTSPQISNELTKFMTELRATRFSAQAGASRDDVGVVELHDCFAANELVTYPTLGLCAVDDAHRFVERGDKTYGGKYVVNPSGGLEAKGHPLGATGLAMHFSITRLFDLPDERGKYGLVHNIGLGGAVVVSLRRPKSYHADRRPTAQTDATDWDIFTFMNCERLPVQMWTRSDPSRTRKGYCNLQSCEGGAIEFLEGASMLLLRALDVLYHAVWYELLSVVCRAVWACNCAHVICPGRHCRPYLRCFLK
ncbi:hypothetical protein EDB84DRAFT_1678107 [Lactarius hengduanensis]|nr:hypothetical protein EDB84DRAFT_1678107 [Lactarius hengduanensis]